MTFHDQTRLVVWIGFAVFACAFLLLGAWDIFLIAKNKLPGNSASSVILDIAHQQPIFVLVIGLILGILVGHFTWPQTLKQ